MINLICAGRTSEAETLKKVLEVIDNMIPPALATNQQSVLSHTFRADLADKLTHLTKE